MSTAATRAALLADAIEDLILANLFDKTEKQREEARQQLSAACLEFTAPVMRLVDDTARDLNATNAKKMHGDAA